MWKILNNVSSAAASLNKYQSQTKVPKLKEKYRKGLSVTLKDCGINSQNSSSITHAIRCANKF